MASIKKIQAFKTSDGRVFEDDGAAQEHQAKIDLREGLRLIVEKFFYRGIDEHNVVDGLMEHEEELRKLIT